MAAHITYLSEAALHRKFGRNLQNRGALSYGFDADFQVESYLRHQGSTFVDRFDANSYLYITRAMDYFDLAADYGGVLAERLPRHAKRASAWSPSPATGCSRPRKAAPSSTRSTPSPPMSASSRSRATGAMTPSCSTSRSCSPPCAASSTARRASRDRVNGASAEPAPRSRASIRIDLQLIADMITPGTRVLDIGCGDGALLDYLVHFKQVDGRGIELSQAGVNACVAHGLSVIQGDADTDLKDYPGGAFDNVILSQTLQATRDPRHVLEELVRIGKRAIVSFPNFGHWRVRWHLRWTGRMPVTAALPTAGTTRRTSISARSTISSSCATRWMSRSSRRCAINGKGRAIAIRNDWLANLFGEQGLFLLRRGLERPISRVAGAGIPHRRLNRTRRFTALAGTAP